MTMDISTKLRSIFKEKNELKDKINLLDVP